MIEHTFDSPEPRPGDFAALVDELRCHTTDWLVAYRAEAIAVQRRAHAWELAATAVLDARGAMDDSVAQGDGVRVRTAREKIKTARA